ncbi:MAG: efflux RND transporter periplasmic adaptor subunit [Acidobacteriota bacterium]|mgnify:CR=1 FL=1|jgi:HlyD family secretion protein
MKRTLIAVGVVVVLGAVVWASLASSGERGQVVEAEKVQRRDVIARVKASGTINPKVKVEIQSKVIGEIVALPVREGDAVRAGQVVLQIEPQLYQAARDQARAAYDQTVVALERARAELANAELEFSRVEALYQQGVVSKEMRDRAALTRDTAAIAVRAQEKTIRQAQSAYQRALDDLERTTIRSPIDGTVTALNVEKGETAVMGTMNFAGSVLMVIGDLSEMVAEVDVAESEVVSLAVGQAATVTADALPGVEMPGTVVEIAASGAKQIDVVRFKVKVALKEWDPRVKPGMSAKAEIVTQRAENVLSVPQQAVQTRWLDQNGKEVTRKEGDRTQSEVSVVYLREEGKAVRRRVSTGVHDEIWVEIKEGLSGGEEVITGPYRVLRSLKDGDPVRLERKKKTKEGSGAD